MRRDIASGETFPDYELTDHQKTRPQRLGDQAARGGQLPDPRLTRGYRLDLTGGMFIE